MSNPVLNSSVIRNSIDLNAYTSITLNAGDGINFQSSQIDVNNVKLKGVVNMEDLILAGTINTRLQSSIFNIFEEQLLNNKNSQCRADQYGATYGPTYGDTLGTVNCRGAFIGTDSTGYIGSTYASKIDQVSLGDLTMPSLVALQTPSSTLTTAQTALNANNNLAIPMNITSFSPNLAQFTTVSFNTDGPVDKQLITDPYFGDLWSLTRSGITEDTTTLVNTLQQDLRAKTVFQISKSGGSFNVQGNIILTDYNNKLEFDQVNVLNSGAVSNYMILSGKIKNNNNLQFTANLLLEDTLTYPNILGNLYIFGENVYSNNAITGVKMGGTSGSLNDGGYITINSNVNYWNRDFFQYAWHANLLNSAVDQLPPITPYLISSSPFSGITGKLILQCGTPSTYNANTREYGQTPLFNNQMAMLSWKFTPHKQAKNPQLTSDFTIQFKYQLYSEIRGDFFYFQYSPDAGRNYYDLIKQSGDIKSIESLALLSNDLWKVAEFYLPGGTTTNYIFRWVYKKDLDISNGYDIVYLADIGVSYTEPVLVNNNGYTQNYSNEFVGNITTGGSAVSDKQSYLLPFPNGIPNSGTGFKSGDINYGGQTNMTNYNWGAERNNSAMYPLINTYYRQDTNPYDQNYPRQNEIHYFRMIDNNGYNGQYTGNVWRMYSITDLMANLAYPINVPGQTSLLSINASTGFLNGTEYALMSSQPNDQTQPDTDFGLTNGEGTFLSLGPFEYNTAPYVDLTTNNHNFEFKFIPDTENEYDLTGVITYDYVLSNGQTDALVRDTLVELLTFSKPYHLLLNDLNSWFNTPTIINTNNIKYYPDTLGIYSGSTNVSGWLNFSASIPKMSGEQGQKRIYVIFFAKDWYSYGANNDIVLLSDIKFTFPTESRPILDTNGVLHGSVIMNDSSQGITNKAGDTIIDNTGNIRLTSGAQRGIMNQFSDQVIDNYGTITITNNSSGIWNKFGKTVIDNEGSIRLTSDSKGIMNQFEEQVIDNTGNVRLTNSSQGIINNANLPVINISGNLVGQIDKSQSLQFSNIDTISKKLFFKLADGTSISVNYT